MAWKRGFVLAGKPGAGGDGAFTGTQQFLTLAALAAVSLAVSGFWLSSGAHSDVPSVSGHDLAFAWQAGLNAVIATAYLVLGLWWIRQLRLHVLGRVTGIAFFIACAATHVDLMLHALDHAPLMLERHMFVVHGVQAAVDWAFVAVAWRYRGITIEAPDAVAARERRLQAIESLETVREEERRRWARELHDQTLQGLAAVRLTLRSGMDGHNGDRPELHSAVDLLDEEIEELRAVISALRPPLLEELGLERAIEAMCERMAERHGFEFTLKYDLRANAATERLATAIYRIIQEGLTNAWKHGRARHVDVSVTSVGDAVSVGVRDDGSGFAEEPGAGFGLIGIEERAEAVGGRMEVISEPGEGTHLLVELPLADLATPRAELG